MEKEVQGREPFSHTLASACASPEPGLHVRHWTAVLLCAQVPDPMESPPRRAYRPPSYQSPEGPSEPKGRRPTVRWTRQVRQKSGSAQCLGCLYPTHLQCAAPGGRVTPAVVCSRMHNGRPLAGRCLGLTPCTRLACASGISWHAAIGADPCVRGTAGLKGAGLKGTPSAGGGAPDRARSSLWPWRLGVDVTKPPARRAALSPQSGTCCCCC